MTWDMQWHDEDKTIIVFTVKEGSTWYEFDLAMAKYCDELESSSKTIHAIIVNDYGFPKSNPLHHIKSQIQRLAKYKNRGVLITVSPHVYVNFVQSIAELVFKLLGLPMNKGAFVKTMSEALRRIELSRMQEVASSS